MGGEMAHDALAMIQYDDRIAVCVLGDSDAAVSRMAATAEAAGCRVAWSGVAGDGAARDGMPGAPALIELDSDTGETALEMLDWAKAEAEGRGRRAFVSATMPMIDLLAARSWHAEIDWVVDGAEDERIAAARRASRSAEPRLNDIGRDEGQPILQRLTEDVSRIAAMLASLTEEEAAALVAAKGKGAEDQAEPELDAAYVRSIIRARRLRDQFFRGGLFADPAWDMLLDLEAAYLEGTRVAVSSLCIAAAVPATTALRWIKTLTDRGLFVRSADPEDGRRVYVALSDDAARALTAYLKATRRMRLTAI